MWQGSSRWTMNGITGWAWNGGVHQGSLHSLDDTRGVNLSLHTSVFKQSEWAGKARLARRQALERELECQSFLFWFFFYPRLDLSCI